MVTFKRLYWRNLFSTGQQGTEIVLNESPTNLLVGTNGSGKCVLGDTKVQVACYQGSTANQLKAFLKQRKDAVKAQKIHNGEKVS